MATPSRTLENLSDDLFATMSAADPFQAEVFHGAPGYEGQVPDFSESGQLSAARRLRGLADQAEQVPAESLGGDDRVTRDVLIDVARSTAAPLDDGHAEFTVSGYASPTALVFAALTNTTVSTGEQEVDYLSRIRGVSGFFDQARTRVLTGVASGRVPTRRGVEQTVERLRAYLRSPLDADLMLMPAIGTGVEDAVRQVVADSVRPAVVRYLGTLAGPVAAAARPDEKSGLLHLPDGAGMYERAAAAHTTTMRSPDDLHRLGLDICAALREEFAELGQKVFGVGDFDAIVERLRHDPGLRYETPEQMLDDARAAVARAEAILPDWFGATPSARCVVEPMNEVVAPTAVLGEYLPPTAGVGRPGRYNLNTYEPQTRTRYEYETLAFHESVPGHHLQFGLAQDLTRLPSFRRYLYIAAFGEGWGLYTERLADEMGLYSADLYRFGMLSFDAWRACRLVVDTGIHHRGWTRDQAIEFMLANSASARDNIVNEIDRYIAWPGQALAYMCGRLEIDDLKQKARERLGPRFDIRDFHDLVLGNGAVPLGVLSAEVDRWLDQETTAA